jgi:RND family efflux transporter MFP subunit
MLSHLSKFSTPLLILVALGALAYVWRAEHRSAAPPLQAEQKRSTELAKPSVGIVAEGRLVAYPGAEVVVGTDLGGTIETFTVKEKDRVRKGALLAVIRANDLRAELTQAQARLREIDADIRLFEAELVRADNLLKAEVGTKQAADRARRDLEAAQARRVTTEAEIRRIQAVLDKSRILAPIDGTITARHVEPGETVIAGSRLVTVADLARTRVETEVDEFDAVKVRVGDQVAVTAEGDSRQWRGKVEEIPDTVSPRRIKPQDPSKPTDARVLLVKVALDGPTTLKLGQRVEVRIQSGVAKGPD